MSEGGSTSSKELDRDDLEAIRREFELQLIEQDVRIPALINTGFLDRSADKSEHNRARRRAARRALGRRIVWVALILIFAGGGGVGLLSLWTSHRQNVITRSDAIVTFIGERHELLKTLQDGAAPCAAKRNALASLQLLLQVRVWRPENQPLLLHFGDWKFEDPCHHERWFLPKGTVLKNARLDTQLIPELRLVKGRIEDSKLRALMAGTKLHLQDVDVVATDFSGAHLLGSTFTRVRFLENTSFEGAILAGVELCNVDFSGAVNLRQEQLEQMRLAPDCQREGNRYGVELPTKPTHPVGFPTRWARPPDP